MADFHRGDKVKVKAQSSSRFRGCTGRVVGTQVRGLAFTYEVSFEQAKAFITQDNRFFGYDLEPANPSTG